MTCSRFDHMTTGSWFHHKSSDFRLFGFGTEPSSIRGPPLIHLSSGSNQLREKIGHAPHRSSSSLHPSSSSSLLLLPPSSFSSIVFLPPSSSSSLHPPHHPSILFLLLLFVHAGRCVSDAADYVTDTRVKCPKVSLCQQRCMLGNSDLFHHMKSDTHTHTHIMY